MTQASSKPQSSTEVDVKPSTEQELAATPLSEAELRYAATLLPLIVFESQATHMYSMPAVVASTFPFAARSMLSTSTNFVDLQRACALILTFNPGMLSKLLSP